MRTPKSDKQKSMIAIRSYLEALPRKQIFYGSILADYVKDRIGNKNIYTDSILRYMRQLRQEGVIKFDVINKRESKYVKL